MKNCSASVTTMCFCSFACVRIYRCSLSGFSAALLIRAWTGRESDFWQSTESNRHCQHGYSICGVMKLMPPFSLLSAEAPVQRASIFSVFIKSSTKGFGDKVTGPHGERQSKQEFIFSSVSTVPAKFLLSICLNV